MVAQVVGEHVVPGVVQDLVVGDQVHLEPVAARRPDRVPGLHVGGYAGPAEGEGVVGDDQLRRPRSGDEPALQRHAVTGGERDVLVLEANLGRPVQHRGPQARDEPVGEPPQRLVRLFPGQPGLFWYAGHRRTPLTAQVQMLPTGCLVSALVIRVA